MITLGIIGIVAALTIPTLVGNYQKKVAAVRLKKFYSTYSQALKLSEVEHGDIQTWDYSKAGLFGDGERNIPFFTKYLYKYMNPIAICDELGHECSVKMTQLGGNLMRVLFQDGSCMGMHVTTTSGNIENGVGFTVLYDINCDRGPNIVGRDKFYFEGNWTINQANNIAYYPLSPYSDYPAEQLKNKTRDELKTRCTEHKSECSALIRYDNWEIKDDYPW